MRLELGFNQANDSVVVRLGLIRGLGYGYRARGLVLRLKLGVVLLQRVYNKGSHTKSITPSCLGLGLIKARVRG